MKTPTTESSVLAIALLALFVPNLSAILANEPSADLLGCWRFEEGTGIYSANSCHPAGEALLHNVAWVQGPFGRALRFGGSDSFVTLPPMPELDGSNQMSIAAWVYWEDTGQYPNILTGGTWSPGGFMLFVNQQSVSLRISGL